MDIVDPSTELEGKTNFIVVDRGKLYQDAFAEISLIDNLRLPRKVNFMGEGAQDFKGTRKEFFRLILTEIKEKLFDNGLNEDFAEDYYTSGINMGLSVLQNGKIPTCHLLVRGTTSRTTVAQKGHTCKLKMLLQTKNFTYKLKILHAN